MSVCYESVVLKNGDIVAEISPSFGMSLVSFKIKGVSILDLKRETHFLETRKGLGPIIGPHFNQSQIVPDVEESRFGHIAHLRALGVKDIFQHGVGRYIGWDFEHQGDSVVGFINGDTEFGGYKLKEINGFDFSMSVRYTLGQNGLAIGFDVRGEKPIQAGIHFYYDLVSRDSASVLLDTVNGQESISFKGKRLDDVFAPKATIDDKACYRLITDNYELDTIVKVEGDKKNTFDSLIVHSPENATFVCVEPISQHDKTKNDKLIFESEILLSPSAKV